MKQFRTEKEVFLLSEKPALSASALKYFAVLAMTIDHIAFVFVDSDTVLYFLMRTIGRTTAPIMAFFIAEGFHYTRNRRNYLVRTLLFALISQLPFSMILLNRIPDNLYELFFCFNVMFTFSLSLIILMILTSTQIQNVLKIILVAVCIVLSESCDWSYMIPAWVAGFYLFRTDRKKKTMIFIGISTILMTCKEMTVIETAVENPEYINILSVIRQYASLLALIPLSFYNGKRGSMNNKYVKLIDKWFFYTYYPLHLAVIALLHMNI